MVGKAEVIQCKKEAEKLKTRLFPIKEKAEINLKVLHIKFSEEMREKRSVFNIRNADRGGGEKYFWTPLELEKSVLDLIPGLSARNGSHDCTQHRRGTFTTI